MLESLYATLDSKRHESNRGRNDDEVNRGFGGYCQHFLMLCKVNISMLWQSNTTISVFNINSLLETFPL